MSEQPAATVLIIDDFHPSSRFIRRAFVKRGVNVLRATTSEEASEMLAAHAGSIGLVVADVVSPTAAVLDLTAEMASRLPELPIIYIAGARKSIVRCSLEARANDCVLVIPFTEDELIERAGALLNVDLDRDENSTDRLWKRLASESRRFTAETAMIHVYEKKEAPLAESHIAALREAAIPYLLRATGSNAKPYSLVISARHLERARRVLERLPESSLLPAA
jgi:DNA-binding NtrC family response regulator